MRVLSLIPQLSLKYDGPELQIILACKSDARSFLVWFPFLFIFLNEKKKKTSKLTAMPYDTKTLQTILHFIVQ